MTAARCPTCDREGCPALRGATWLIEACACGGFDCYLCRNQHDCEANRVDWRARALAAEADAAKASRTLDAILDKLGARDTGTGGQTVEAGNARIMHDGMRRLERAIADAARWRKVAPLIEAMRTAWTSTDQTNPEIAALLAATQEPTP